MAIETERNEVAEDPLSPHELLRALHARGATRLTRVTFRNNRSTVWSLTRDGTVLNVHAAYRSAPGELVDALARIAVEGGVASSASRRASNLLREWPPVLEAIEAARSSADSDSRASGSAHCCATSDQSTYLRALYAYFNRTRFRGALPDDVPVRLSNRMRSALGHMLPGVRDGRRVAIEIALNVDLMLDGNGAERADTLLHEMAHIADYLASGHRGHGASWKAWARRVGCRPTTLYDRPVARRPRGATSVTRVPPLPAPLRVFAR